MKIAPPWFVEGSSKARLIWVTPNGEEIIAHVARVSNPKNQDNEKYEGLLKYCIKHNHVSIFETACMCVEVITPLAIATQMLRHRSFTFQQLSLRYSSNEEIKDLLGKLEIDITESLVTIDLKTSLSEMEKLVEFLSSKQ